MRALFAQLLVAATAFVVLLSAAGLAKAEEGGPPKCVKGEVDTCVRECSTGRAGSCAALGYTFVDGVRVPRDPETGAYFRKRACDGNEFNACGNLAWQYINGVGVPKDFAAARTYAEKGCRGGDGVACANLRFLSNQPQNPASRPPGSTAPCPAAPEGSPAAAVAASSAPQPGQRGSSAPSSDEISKSLPNDEASNSAIDNGFKQWSSAWMFDRYIPGSARAVDRGFRDGTYVIRGAFAFMRGGGRLNIPFAAAFTNPGEGYRLSNLCYNDVTTSQTDCIDPSDGGAQQRAAARSRAFLGSIVLVGLAAAMTSTTEVCERRTTLFSDYVYCH